jgi:hypothetical protein
MKRIEVVEEVLGGQYAIYKRVHTENTSVRGWLYL